MRIAVTGVTGQLGSLVLDRALEAAPRIWSVSPATRRKERASPRAASG